MHPAIDKKGSFMRLVQFKTAEGDRKVGRVSADGNHLQVLAETASVRELAEEAIVSGVQLVALVESHATEGTVDYEQLLREGRVLSPLDHDEPARFLITGTGLTHTGSANARDKMHILTHGEDAEESDSLKIFRRGLTGGKPAEGELGVQPEWFFKGVGTCVVAPGAALPMPAFARAGAEEAEIVGLYIVGPDRSPYRIGYALGNEYSDHITEAENYLYLAHSKLRSCSIGPELLVGDLPAEVRGHSRIRRDGAVIWEEEFLSGETHMSHSIANLEHYHFRYPMHRRPGDLHAYFFGAAVMSYAFGVQTGPGDEYEIEAEIFGKPLRNRVELSADEGLVTVTQL